MAGDSKKKVVREIIRRLKVQLYLVGVRNFINFISNMLGEDYISLILRRGLLQLYGARFGPRTLHIEKSFLVVLSL